MLCRGGKAIWRGEIRSLEAAGLGRRHLASNPSVFAGALDDAAPARVARHVKHRREGQRNAILRSFFGGDARRFLPKIGVEQASFRQGDGKNRVMAMDDVETHKQGNAETRFLDREALDVARFVRPPKIEQVSDPSSSNSLLQIAKLAGTSNHAGRRDHIELPDLFLERHRGEQRIDASHAPAFISAASRWFRPAIALERDHAFASGLPR